ncbi:single-stranded DNA-binding protein, partial [Patescibacteria group bacterium]
MDLNKVMLIGRVTQDPEIRTIPSGASVANFGFATGRRWKDKQSGEQKEQTEF